MEGKPITILRMADKVDYQGRVHGVGCHYLDTLPCVDSGRFRLIVYTLRGDDSIGKMFEDRGLRLRILHRRKFDPFTLLNLLRIIREEGVDLLHVDNWEVFFWGRVIGALTGKPVVVHLHDLYLEDRYHWYLRWSDRLLNRYIRKVIAVSEAVAGSCRNVWNLPEEKIEVIENCVPLERYDHFSEKDRLALRLKLGLPTNAPIIGTITRFHPVKGNQYLMEAASSVLKEFPEALFVLVGDGPLRGELEEQTRRLGIKDWVQFLGFRQDVAEILAAIDIKVLSSLSEGLPNALIEAKAAGCAIVATRVGGVPEIVTDGHTGLLVPSGDPEALADRIIYLLKNPAERRRLGEAARKDSRRHDIRSYVAKLEKLYEELVSKP